MDLKDYDALLSLVYECGLGQRPIAEMFQHIWAALNADSAGVSIYDEGDRLITHTLVSVDRSLPRGFIEKALPINEEPGVKLVTNTRLPMPRRFTDIVPEGRLRNMEWYRKQTELSGLGHGIMVDVAIAGVRVRLFAVRQHGAANFSQDDLELIGMLGGHFRRAFTSSLSLLSPRRIPGKLQLIMYSEADLAGAFRDQSIEKQLAVQYDLTPAEQRVLKVMARGVTRKIAADELEIGINSLKTHMRRIYAKLGLKRLPDIVLLIQRLEASARAGLSSRT